VTLRSLAPARDTATVEEILDGLVNGPPLAPFSPEVRDFCAKLSRALFTDPRSKKLPDLQALAFHLRPAEIQRLEDGFRATAPPRLQPRGLALHIAPANVETMFVYSWLFSALMGNRNLVRISSEAPETALLLARVFAEVLEGAPEAMRQSIAIVQYGHDSDITGAFSAACDVRVIWGGDETVRAIRAIPLAPRATEIVFADRYSFAVLRAGAYLALDQAARAALADKFFNDTFWFDQMACSSPRLVVWHGDPDETAQAARAFYGDLAAAIKRRGHSPDTGTAITRFAFACRAALDGPVTTVERHGGGFETVALAELTPFCREHCGGGLLYQFHTLDLSPLAGFVDRRDQTVTYFGYEGDALEELARRVSVRGVDRIVPVGKALEFGRYWDGYDLFLEFSRHVDLLK
jgi:hypothetical protein